MNSDQRNNRQDLDAFGLCQSNFHVYKYGKAVRFSMHGTVNSFNAQLEDNCGQLIRCNFWGYFDKFGFLKDFQHQCIADVEEYARRELVAEAEKRLREEMAKAKYDAEEIAMVGVRKLMGEAAESAEARLVERHAQL